jgi:hypothetical protein
MRLLILIFLILSMSSVARAQDPYMQLTYTCMQAYGADVQRCNCWAHTLLGLLRPDDLAAVMRGQDTPNSTRAHQIALSQCRIR